ncbi:MAG: Gfo/Idh/MocA family oxidoreductase [Candidatus Sulfopaludibacter sp.]|nr:Gfo/Idh/MocA family oxidoreductase [Candidatus Sulfopaludibacter sp.]
MSDQDRRKFLGTAAGVAAFTILPRRVLGGPGFVAPSDKVTLAHIGVGTEGLREMLPLLSVPELQIVAVCDPNQHASGYRDWSANGILNSVRRTLGKPDWWAGGEGTIPGGRDCAKDIVDTAYGNKSCAAYADFRELFEKEKDVDAVKIMTPDHLHGVIAMAAMRRGKHTIVHKPIANRLNEARLVIDTARAKGVATHFMPWDSNGNMEPVMAWINQGEIGTLREVHNWTNRPVWPQYATIPTDTPPVPQGFNWDLWLGPEAQRPYHPHYTHMVFRGWYDFGGGSMADMGHYSLWTVFNALELSGPTSVEPMFSHHCAFNESVSTTIKNDFSFPTAGVVRFKYPARGQRPPIELIWYEGGMHPTTPEELEQDHQELPLEGMMFVGDKGKILAGFHVDSPRLIPESRMRGKVAPPPRGGGQTQELTGGLKQWLQACKGGAQSPGNFLNAWPITEAVNLYAVALRTRKRLMYDAESRKITNVSEANQYLSRDYRKGWEPETV